MPASRQPKSIVRELGFSRKDILALDSTLFSAEEKKAYIELLYGNPNEWSWKRDLESAPMNLRRWRTLLAEKVPLSGSPYRVRYEKLLSLARRRPPKAFGGSVTDFTDWIFRLYVPERHYASLLRGQRLEREIAAKRIPVPAHSRWKLIYNGMHESTSSALPISCLLVNGAPMRGKPDLVFREKGARRFLVLDLKTSEADIPSDGWPNMRAQLWAYSKIDAWSDADEVILAAEIRGFNGLRLRKAIRWNGQDQTLERESMQLLDCYRDLCPSPADSTGVPRT